MTDSIDALPTEVLRATIAVLAASLADLDARNQREYGLRQARRANYQAASEQRHALAVMRDELVRRDA